MGLPFYEVYRDKPVSTISGAFENTKSISQIETNMQSGPETSDSPGKSSGKGQLMSIDRSRSQPEKKLDMRIIMIDVDDTVPRFKSIVEDRNLEDDSSDEDGS